MTAKRQILKTGAEKERLFWPARANLAAPGLSARGGRGLFAIVNIAANTIIEKACTVEIHPDQSAALDTMQPVGDYYFEHPRNKKAGLMAFGLMSLCNHSNDANADVIWEKNDELGWLANLVTIKSIVEGEEITYRYKCPLWFSVKN